MFASKGLLKEALLMIQYLVLSKRAALYRLGNFIAYDISAILTILTCI